MIALLFDQTRLPRSMKRCEWVEIHRWRRTTQKRLKEETERHIDVLRQHIEEVHAFGSSMLRVSEAIGDIVNPPVLLGPYQDRGPLTLEIGPGRVAYA